MSTAKGERYMSGRNPSIRNYNKDSTCHPEDLQSHDGSESYGHGGSGTGQAGGYSGKQSKSNGQGPSQSEREGNTKDDITVDDYGRFDPGLAAWKRPEETDVCRIPGIRQMGGVKYIVNEGRRQTGGNVPTCVRGYECDRESYEDLCSSGTKLESLRVSGEEKVTGKIVKDPGLKEKEEK